MAVLSVPSSWYYPCHQCLLRNPGWYFRENTGPHDKALHAANWIFQHQEIWSELQPTPEAGSLLLKAAGSAIPACLHGSGPVCGTGSHLSRSAFFWLRVDLIHPRLFANPPLLAILKCQGFLGFSLGLFEFSHVPRTAPLPPAASNTIESFSLLQNHPSSLSWGSKALRSETRTVRA